MAFGSREVRPEVVPKGRVLDARVRGDPRACSAIPTVRRIFLIFGVSFLATQMSRPYIPVLVEGLAGHGPGPRLGDRARDGHGGAGRRRSCRRSAACSATGSGSGRCSSPRWPAAAWSCSLMPFVRRVAALAAPGRRPRRAATATVSAMVFGLLAIEVPAERRSATLNLVYLPLYAAGIVGPALGAVVAAIGGRRGAVPRRRRRLPAAGAIAIARPTGPAARLLTRARVPCPPVPTIGLPNAPSALASTSIRRFGGRGHARDGPSPRSSRRRACAGSTSSRRGRPTATGSRSTSSSTRSTTRTSTRATSAPSSTSTTTTSSSSCTSRCSTRTPAGS